MPNSLVVPSDWTAAVGYAGVVYPQLAEPPAADGLFVLGPGGLPDAESLQAGENAATYQAQSESGTESIYTLVKDVRDMMLGVLQLMFPAGGGE